MGLSSSFFQFRGALFGCIPPISSNTQIHSIVGLYPPSLRLYKQHAASPLHITIRVHMFFLLMGYPQFIHFNRIFQYKPSSYSGAPMSMDPPQSYTITIYNTIYIIYIHIHVYSIYIYVLVGGFNPSEKYEFINWDDEIPN